MLINVALDTVVTEDRKSSAEEDTLTERVMFLPSVSAVTSTETAVFAAFSDGETVTAKEYSPTVTVFSESEDTISVLNVLVASVRTNVSERESTAKDRTLPLPL